MPRDIPVGNGKLLICFDRNYMIRDLYFPHVGQENHLSGNFCRFGIFTNNHLSWVGKDWKKELAYEEDTLVTHVDLYHPDLAVIMTCRDTVDFHENVYLREISLENLLPEARNVELFFSHDFDISGNNIGDTATYDPESGGIIHYKASRYFLINGKSEHSDSLSQFAVGGKRVGDKEGTFKDAEDGILSGNTVAQGSVDSVVSLLLELDAHAKRMAYYWICVGEDWDEVRRIDNFVKHKHPASLIKRTADYWKLWVRKETPPLDYLSKDVGHLYRRSLLVLSTQLDWKGGIIAANDSDVIQYNRDTYSYVWPRDGALVANALDLAGYPIPAQRFYEFAAGVIEKEGYLLHKYNPDGTLASSWHPWYDASGPQLPIQEDETALVVWALWQHFVQYRDVEFIKPLYQPLVKKPADFMVSYRDKETGLPGPSYDLWEEQRGILSFTVGAVFGGLTAASLFCAVFGENERAEAYRKAASEIRDGASKYLWRADLGRFCRMLFRNSDGLLQPDEICDSSLWGLFAFGMYAPDDSRIKATMETLRHKLWLKTEVGGMARYENDDYYRISADVPGNPWFISTLWLADYLIKIASEDSEFKQAAEILDWISDHALPSGVLPEQLHPYSGEALSVSPLTWSHGSFISVTQHYIRRITEQKGAPHDRFEDWIGKLFGQTCNSIYGSCRIK
jgi:GH15 family glucan-1,4-alpha-glucosidase